MFKEKNPLVSIVIPVYNGMPYVKEAIDSVLAQDYPNIELIVLDDGSTDDTVKLLEKYNGAFYYESHPNMGQAATLNKGWGMSKGEVLGYLNADDILFPNAISVSVKYFFDDPDVVLTYPDNTLIDNKSNFIRKVRLRDYDYYYMVNNVSCLVMVGSFFLASAFKKIGGWNKKYNLILDYEHQLRLADLGKFKHIPHVFASYRMHNEARSQGRVSFAEAEEIKNLMIEYLEETHDLVILKNKEKILGRAYLLSARTHWRSSRYLQGFRYLCHAVYLDPFSLLRTGTYRIIFNVLFNRRIHALLRWLNKFKK